MVKIYVLETEETEIQVCSKNTYISKGVRSP